MVECQSFKLRDEGSTPFKPKKMEKYLNGRELVCQAKRCGFKSRLFRE